MKSRRPLLSRQDPRDLPTYGIVEAAHYLRLPAATLRGWAIGRPYLRSDGQQFSEPILTLPNRKKPVLSFINLVEAHVLGAIRRRYRIPFHKVRNAVVYLREELHSRHPLADHEFTTDGISLFIEHLGRFINVTEEGQLAMRQLLLAYLRRIERDPYEEYRERMRARMASPEGRAAYRRRRETVEPRIGWIQHGFGVRRFLRRGLEPVRTEGSLICTVANLAILLRHWVKVAAVL